jgi:hypothetical protein
MRRAALSLAMTVAACHGGDDPAKTSDPAAAKTATGSAVTAAAPRAQLVGCWLSPDRTHEPSPTMLAGDPDARPQHEYLWKTLMRALRPLADQLRACTQTDGSAIVAFDLDAAGKPIAPIVRGLDDPGEACLAQVFAGATLPPPRRPMSITCNLTLGASAPLRATPGGATVVRISDKQLVLPDGTIELLPWRASYAAGVGKRFAGKAVVEIVAAPAAKIDDVAPFAQAIAALDHVHVELAVELPGGKAQLVGAWSSPVPLPGPKHTLLAQLRGGDVALGYAQAGSAPLEAIQPGVAPLRAAMSRRSQDEGFDRVVMIAATPGTLLHAIAEVAGVAYKTGLDAVVVGVL